MKYHYAWGNNEKRKTLKGLKCEVLHRLSRNSVHVRFENGQEEIISRNAIRRLSDG